MVVVCAAWCPATATAADPARTPSGESLRETYPLQTKPPESLSPGLTPAASRRAGQRTQVQPPKKAESGAAPLLAVPLILMLGLAMFWLVRRRGSGGEAPAEETAAPPPRRPSLLSLAIFEAAPAPKPALALRPPDPTRTWTAEIAWRNANGESRFVVCARPDRGAEAVVLTSDPIRWPPSSADDVASLQRVVSELEAALLGAGWTSLEPGQAWYARRLAWSPLPSSPAVTGPERRFGRESAPAAWRCEVEWRFLTPGWGFRAYAVSPQLRSRRVIAESAVFPTRDARETPAGRAALDGLVTALAEAGWAPSESGTPSVWAGEGEPRQLPPTAVAQFTERNQT